jgi:hypothetical protein
MDIGFLEPGLDGHVHMPRQLKHRRLDNSALPRQAKHQRPDDNDDDKDDAPP